MLAKIYRITKRLLLLLVIVTAVFFAARVYITQRGASLAIWHTYVPREMKAAELDTADWSRYLAEEPPSGPEAIDKGTSWTVKDAVDLILGPAPEQDEREPAGP